MQRIGKLVVVGVGLIGGSFALALKAAAAVREVVGVGRGGPNLEQARRLGIVDRGYSLEESWGAELVDADLVLLATPLGQMSGLMRAIAPSLGAHTVVTDAGSTKQDVVASARAALGSALPRFVAGHPIAGTERSGAVAASAALFQGRTVVLTPASGTDPNAVDLVAACWKLCGGNIRMLEPARHDQIFAAVSHLPHALAYALVAELAARPDADDYFEFAATGFRDFTRLASSSPEIWRDITVANAAALRQELAAYRRVLDRLDASLAAGDRESILALFEHAQRARDRWIGRSGSSDS
jgi:prephenate dehydrogenase